MTTIDFWSMVAGFASGAFFVLAVTLAWCKYRVFRCPDTRLAPWMFWHMPIDRLRDTMYAHVVSSDVCQQAAGVWFKRIFGWKIVVLYCRAFLGLARSQSELQKSLCGVLCDMQIPVHVRETVGVILIHHAQSSTGYSYLAEIMPWQSSMLAAWDFPKQALKEHLHSEFWRAMLGFDRSAMVIVRETDHEKLHRLLLIGVDLRGHQ